jgi:RNA polymerase sigma factor (sigma-70 family)
VVEPLSGAGLSAAKWFAGLRLGYTTKRHTRLVVREYEDRVRWARDQRRAEDEALTQLAEEMNAQNLFYSGAHENGKRKIREAFAHQWRDRKSHGDRLVEDQQDEEHFLHAGWRRFVARRPWPENEHAAETEDLTRAWEVELEAERNRLLERVEKQLEAGADANISALERVQGEVAATPANTRPEDSITIRDAIRAGITRLPEQEKLVVTLYYYEDLSLSEIARILAIRPGEVQKLLNQAIANIRGDLP